MSSMAPDPANQRGSQQARSSLDTQNAAVLSENDSEVLDLSNYVNILVRWWREIALIALLCGVLLGGGSWLMQAIGEDMYAASADAAIVRTVTEVTLDERFVTTAENPTANALTARRNALVALALNPALAEVVIEELGADLPEDLRNPAILASHVEAEMGNASGTGDSDLIRITVTTNDPEISSKVATAWTQAFVRNVNQVYGQVPDELFNSIVVEQQTSRINYESAQQAYEQFLAVSRVDEVSRLITDREAVINSLRRGRTDLLDALVDNAIASRSQVAEAIGNAQAENMAAPIVAEQEGKRDLLKGYVDTIYQGQVEVVSQQGLRDRQLLQSYYTRWLQVSRALDDVEALRGQTMSLGESGAATAASGSSALVLTLLKLQAFTAALDTPVTQAMAVDTPSDVIVNAPEADTQSAAAPGLVQSSQPVQVQVGATPLQIQLSDTSLLTNAEILAELNALVAALDQRRDDLETAIESLSAAILSGASIQTADVAPSQHDLAASLPAIVEAVLGTSIVTTTVSAQRSAATWEVGDLAGLYNTADLQALALAQGGANDPLYETILAREAELRALRVQLEKERTTLNELTQARDLAQDAYRSANSKQTELLLARAGAGGELRFAAPAVAPVMPVSGISPLLAAIAGAMAGLVLGVVYAFFADAMGHAPFLSRRGRGKHEAFATA